ncbi:MAG: hypothetical protein OEZ68_09400 [Gammaproteobacteria bacterium]|nr:hypothetical protein [Gammaproteobacteria bacterium]MDH5801003.1 hypothetical protein [Gammaproteobacteria bacterium]
MLSQKIHLTLVLPGLAGLSPEAQQVLGTAVPDCPGLSHLLSISRRHRGQHSLEQQLLNWFAWPASMDCPLAALEVRGELPQAYSKDAWYMKLTPVHMLADRDRLVLLPGKELSQTQSQTLFGTMNQLYANEPWQLLRGQSGAWYIQSKQVYDVQTTALGQAMGADLNQCMPQGPDGAYWRSVMTEMQMLMHQQLLLEPRQADSYPCNGVWLWAQGILGAGPSLQSSWTQVYGDHALLQGLATLTDTPLASLQQAQSWLQQLQQPCSINAGRHLLVLPALPSLNGASLSNWGGLLQQYDEQWFCGVDHAVQKGAIASVCLWTAAGQEYHCKPKRWQRILPRRRRLWYEYMTSF